MPVPLDLNLTIRHHTDDGGSVVDLISHLKQVEGAKSYDGEGSCQVLLPLKGGGYLRIGTTDENDSFWVDRYGGLPIQGGRNLQTGKPF